MATVFADRGMMIGERIYGRNKLMPSKVIPAPRGSLPALVVRMLRLAIAFAMTSVISYCGISSFAPVDNRKPAPTAIGAERPVPP